jgi:TM2 domain-containing membrane protein YozV
MRQKSKFMTFLLSFIPGLAHFYLGYADRGLIYLIIFGALCVGSVGLAVISGSEEFLILLLGTPIIWLVALIDSFSIMNNIRYGNDSSLENNWNLEETKVSNKKIITLGLSIIPGAGHMYLGYQQKGLALMGGFFFTIFFMGWLNLSMLLFILPLIWFYSFFDAFHILNGNDIEDIDMSKILPNIKHEYIGFGLIGMGLLITFQRIVYPLINQYIDWQIRNYIQTSIVSLIFIIVGLKMLKVKKVEEAEGEEDYEE